jgi:hypothetical protein
LTNRTAGVILLIRKDEENMTNLKDYLHDLAIEVLNKQVDNEDLLTDEEIDELVENSLDDIKKRLIGGGEHE